MTGIPEAIASFNTLGIPSISTFLTSLHAKMNISYSNNSLIKSSWGRKFLIFTFSSNFRFFIKSFNLFSNTPSPIKVSVAEGKSFNIFLKAFNVISKPFFSTNLPADKIFRLDLLNFLNSKGILSISIPP